MVNTNEIVISAGVIFRDNRGKRQFFIVKEKGKEDWEIPKTPVRRGESSVRAVLRMTGESGGMNARVLEEVGRATNTVTNNGKVMKQKTYYYLLMAKSTGEILGFEDHKWLDYAQVGKQLALKREKEIYKDAKDVLKDWEEKRAKKKLANPEI